MEKPTEGRFHPLIPTPKEVQANHQLFYTDQTAKVYHIEVTNDKKQPKKNLTIVSVSIRRPEPRKVYDSVGEAGETDQQVRARFARLSRFLANANKIHQPDIIVLQEVDKRFPEDMKAFMGNSWATQFEEKKGLLTCYNPKKLTLVTSTPEQQNAPIMDSCQRLQFTFTQSTLVLHNVHDAAYSPLPFVTEKHYKQLLDQDNCLVVVVGVTPSNIAPVNNTTKCENIITRVALPPPFILFQEEPDYPDGCFYKDNRTSKQSNYVQVDGDTLDFQTGEKYKKPKEVDGLEIASAPESLRKYRWVVQIDSRYSQWQGLGLTQEQWESLVKTTTSDSSAKIGLATNS